MSFGSQRWCTVTENHFLCPCAFHLVFFGAGWSIGTSSNSPRMRMVLVKAFLGLRVDASEVSRKHKSAYGTPRLVKLGQGKEDRFQDQIDWYLAIFSSSKQWFAVVLDFPSAAPPIQNFAVGCKHGFIVFEGCVIGMRHTPKPKNLRLRLTSECLCTNWTRNGAA